LILPPNAEGVLSKDLSAAVHVGVNATGLPKGVYQGSLTVQDVDGIAAPVTVPVRLTVDTNLVITPPPIGGGNFGDVPIADSTTTMMAYNNQIGQTFVFQVTGDTSGRVWGTDIYSSDSALATASVHAGLLRPGQSGRIKVTMVQAPTVFQGSTRNGVTSLEWTTGWYAAYRLQLA
jgi:hypothetical protein